VQLGEKGTSGEASIELTEAEIKVADKMGVSREDLINSKKGGK
jgi:hypothetical protein